jgi:hypothetical protein
MLRSKSLDRDSYNSGDWFNRSSVILVFKLLSQLIKSDSNIYLLINYKFVITIILHVFNLVLVDSIHFFLLCGDACHVP